MPYRLIMCGRAIQSSAFAVDRQGIHQVSFGSLIDIALEFGARDPGTLSAATFATEVTTTEGSTTWSADVSDVLVSL